MFTFSQTIWSVEDHKFQQVTNTIKIPNNLLDSVDFVDLSVLSDLDKIPNEGGCYWIWTDEPVIHRLHKHKLPPLINNGEIIYNGIAKDNIRLRIKNHLFGTPSAEWSGVSIDLDMTGQTKSHRKKACGTNKVPYLMTGTKIIKKGSKKGILEEVFSPIKNKSQLLTLNLSQQEHGFIKQQSSQNIFYFRNGIDVTDMKHQSYKFRVYYIFGLNPIYIEYVEKKWRELYGLPKLCSYSAGR